MATPIEFAGTKALIIAGAEGVCPFIIPFSDAVTDKMVNDVIVDYTDLFRSLCDEGHARDGDFILAIADIADAQVLFDGGELPNPWPDSVRRVAKIPLYGSSRDCFVDLVSR